MCISPLFSNRQRLSYDVCLEVRGEIIRTVLCCIVHSHKHTEMSSSYSSLDWVLSHWAHFTVRKLIYLCLSVCILCVFVLYCIVVVLL